MPDNVLFADQAGEVFEILMEDCDLHTVLRCPRGTFSPYTEGTKTNVIFFTKGYATEQTWIYDARANVPKITKKSRPLTASTLRRVRAVLRRRPERPQQAHRGRLARRPLAQLHHRRDQGAPLQARRLQVDPRRGTRRPRRAARA